MATPPRCHSFEDRTEGEDANVFPQRRRRQKRRWRSAWEGLLVDEEELQPLVRIRPRRGGGSVDHGAHTWTLDGGCGAGLWSNTEGSLGAFGAPTGVVASLLVGALLRYTHFPLGCCLMASLSVTELWLERTRSK
ncbi:hypothetical protein BHE74_00050568 [Ensete ventricosum]|nr:hypothetical protein BHE74_00050568 [Ensete ventricosum]